jgi:hypothetical protein
MFFKLSRVFSFIFSGISAILWHFIYEMTFDINLKGILSTTIVIFSYPKLLSFSVHKHVFSFFSQLFFIFYEFMMMPMIIFGRYYSIYVILHLATANYCQWKIFANSARVWTRSTSLSSFQRSNWSPTYILHLFHLEDTSLLFIFLSES